MKERPILFSGAMVRAILADQKTQTRRLMHSATLLALRRDCGTDQLDGWRTDGHGEWYGYRDAATTDGLGIPATDMLRCPYGVEGDALWVREAWRTKANLDAKNATQMAEMAAGAGWSKPWAPIEYTADGHTVNDDALWSGGWGRPRLARFMPRWASRLTLAIVNVRVERLLDITDEDAEAEGVLTLDGQLDDAAICRAAKTMACKATDSRAWFGALWDEINGERAPLASNPWVWCVSFEVVP